MRKVGERTSERERGKRERVCVRERACVRNRERVCVWVREREREIVDK